MINLTISQLINQIDKSYFTLYTEWQETYFKIILFRSCTVPLSGEMHIENANYFLDHLSESLDIYLEKTRQAFSGKNEEIQFFLQDDTFTWKQQNILTRGKITVYPLSNILILSDTLKQMLEHYQTCQERILVLEKENECLNKTNVTLIADIEKMIDIKNTMEKDLYSKFLILLNTKKQKIRELQATLDNKKQITKSIYDETTDESEEESDVESRKKQKIRIKSTRKCKEDYKHGETIPKISKKNFKRHINFSSSKSTSPEPSTSKGKSTIQETDVHYTKDKLLNTSEEESENDIFS